MDAVVGRVGGRCGVGHSYGAELRAGRCSPSHLVLYEPSLGLRYPPGSIDVVEEAWFAPPALLGPELAGHRVGNRQAALPRRRTA